MCFILFTALTHTNKDKADIALDDAENNAHFAKKTQYGTDINIQFFCVYLSNLCN